MALARPPQHSRSFGMKQMVDYAQRGVGAIMAAKGVYDTARNIYTIGKAAAPIVASSLALL